VHEVSIAQRIVEVIRDTADRNGGGRVASAVLRVGELSCVDPETLAFAFDASCRGDPTLDGCSLRIERVPARLRCRACAWEGGGDPFAGCPACGARGFDVLDGRELRLQTIDLEQA